MSSVIVFTVHLVRTYTQLDYCITKGVPRLWVWGVGVYTISSCLPYVAETSWMLFCDCFIRAFMKYDLQNVFWILAGLWKVQKRGKEWKRDGYWTYYVYTSVKIMTTASSYETVEFCAVISLANVVILSSGLHNWERGEPFVWGDIVGGFSVAWNPSPQGPGGGNCKRTAAQVMMFDAGE